MQKWEAALETERLLISSPEAIYELLSKLPKPESFATAADFIHLWH